MDFISATHTWTISLSLAQLRRNIFSIYGLCSNVSANTEWSSILTSACLFGVSSLNFLGHHIDRQGVTPLQDKAQVVRDFPQPTSQRKLREFMGLVNFYHRFLPHCAELMRPLHVLLTHKTQTETWNDVAVAAFNATKDTLANATLLSYPKQDAPTCLMTDASDTAVLHQYIDGTWHPISFFSKKLRPTKTRYSTFDRELLAVYLAIKHFLEGRHFHVLTDHKPLTYALNSRPDRHSPRQQDTSTTSLNSPLSFDMSRGKTIRWRTLCHASRPMPWFQDNRQ